MIFARGKERGWGAEESGKGSRNQGARCRRGEAFRLRQIRRLGYTPTFVLCLRNPQGSGTSFSQSRNGPEGDSGFAGITHNKEKKVNSRMFTPTRSGCQATIIRTAGLAAAS